MMNIKYIEKTMQKEREIEDLGVEFVFFNEKIEVSIDSKKNICYN